MMVNGLIAMFASTIPVIVADRSETLFSGHWAPYSTFAARHLGALTIEPRRLRFARGLSFGTTGTPARLVLDRPSGARVRTARLICGGPPPRSATLAQGSNGRLELSFYRTIDGPASDTDPRPLLCARVTFVRATR